MKEGKTVFLGIDCGATTSKVGGIDGEGNPLSRELRQQPTNSEAGRDGILEAWIKGAEDFLRGTARGWQDVAGVGLAIPGPYLSYGVLGKMPNMPAALEGWRFLEDLGRALEKRSSRHIPAVTANDGLLAGLAEARLIQREEPGAVLMLAPGSGLGCSYVDVRGLLLGGDHQAAVILCHMPAPHEQLGLPAFRCGCGRTWGCFEAYTSISGLPRLLEHFLPDFPGHDLANDGVTPIKERVLSLRCRAQEGDPLAMKIFDTQARALGMAAATGAMAYDPTHIVIGGGLMDPSSTTPEFRRRYLDRVRESTSIYSWVPTEQLTFRQAALGELSQAIGAALLALGQEALPSRCTGTG